MSALLPVLVPLLVALAAFLVFVYKDAKAAYDNDPSTPTLSSAIRRIPYLGKSIAAAAVGGAAYLVLHLWLGVI